MINNILRIYFNPLTHTQHARSKIFYGKKVYAFNDLKLLCFRGDGIKTFRAKDLEDGVSWISSRRARGKIARRSKTPPGDKVLIKL